MPRKFDDEVLSRWLDDELERSQRSEIAHALSEDATLAREVDGLRAQDERIRSWFETEPASNPELESSVRAAFAARRARRPGKAWGRWMMPAAAAAMVMVAGFAGFDYMIDRRVDAALDQLRAERASDLALLASAMQDVLETRESGVAVSFDNSETGFSVTIVPKRTWKSASGHWCREFAEVLDRGPAEAAPVSTACRTPDGRWVRVSTELPGAQFPMILEKPRSRKL